MKAPLYHLIPLISLILPATLQARTWKEAGSGRTVEGDYVRTEGGQVLIRKAGGTTLKIALSKLSEEDQKFVSEQSAPKEEAVDKDVFKWETDFDLAKKRAKEEKKDILVDFTGSDWCGWCIRLKKEVFDQRAFQEYAKKHLIMVELDYPRKKKLPEKEAEQNKKLAEEYEIQGYPTILLLNSKGREVARTGYQEGGPEKYIEHVKELLK
ncbi:thioredoxin family protein [Luteolibacter sp. GHJ8]|uniref:Thioredoxin family protein n=1 Tax=Luteolibacter rhizosphaerae TaxID=2989719 RepID=A0ABT3G3F8_9BACT|nr:thioredoxin family protein [Luteolibacter rhizosphaerae]MCW1914192.1 thioredoxin family protein [Luteolibacter rhizosphaerae]